MADEKYRLTLEGSEVDEALLRLANYEDEGLVLGSRKGVMLGPESEYYHKNARYYAELAQSAVPGDTTSAVRWDIDQSALTDADRELARKNIRAGGSNRNLLDNPWFTVNQRSATTLTLNGTEDYIADRWIVGAFGTYTHNSNHTITITCPNDTTYAGLTQRIDPVYKGGTYTYSIRLNDDTVISLQGTMPSGSGLNVYSITINNISWQVLFRSDGSAYWVTLRCNVANTTITIKAVKLELGSVSTLANDVLPDYGTELAKCQRYFWRLNGAGNYSAYGLAVAPTTTTANLFVTTPVQMRTTPTVTFSGTFQLRVYDSAGDTRGITAISVDTIASNVIKLTITAASLTVGWVMQLRNAGATGYIDFSADL